MNVRLPGRSGRGFFGGPSVVVAHHEASRAVRIEADVVAVRHAVLVGDLVDELSLRVVEAKFAVQHAETVGPQLKARRAVAGEDLVIAVIDLRAVRLPFRRHSGEPLHVRVALLHASVAACLDMPVEGNLARVVLPGEQHANDDLGACEFGALSVRGEGAHDDAVLGDISGAQPVVLRVAARTVAGAHLSEPLRRDVEGDRAFLVAEVPFAFENDAQSQRLRSVERFAVEDGNARDVGRDAERKRIVLVCRRSIRFDGLGRGNRDGVRHARNSRRVRCARYARYARCARYARQYPREYPRVVRSGRPVRVVCPHGTQPLALEAHFERGDARGGGLVLFVELPRDEAEILENGRAFDVARREDLRRDAHVPVLDHAAEDVRRVAADEPLANDVGSLFFHIRPVPARGDLREHAVRLPRGVVPDEGFERSQRCFDLLFVEAQREELLARFLNPRGAELLRLPQQDPYERVVRRHERRRVRAGRRGARNLVGIGVRPAADRVRIDSVPVDVDHDRAFARRSRAEDVLFGQNACPRVADAASGRPRCACVRPSGFARVERVDRRDVGLVHGPPDRDNDRSAHDVECDLRRRGPWDDPRERHEDQVFPEFPDGFFVPRAGGLDQRADAPVDPRREVDADERPVVPPGRAALIHLHERQRVGQRVPLERLVEHATRDVPLHSHVLDGRAEVLPLLREAREGRAKVLRERVLHLDRLGRKPASSRAGLRLEHRPRTVARGLAQQRRTGHFGRRERTDAPELPAEVRHRRVAFGAHLRIARLLPAHPDLRVLSGRRQDRTKLRVRAGNHPREHAPSGAVGKRPAAGDIRRAKHRHRDEKVLHARAPRRGAERFILRPREAEAFDGRHTVPCVARERAHRLRVERGRIQHVLRHLREGHARRVPQEGERDLFGLARLGVVETAGKRFIGLHVDGRIERFRNLGEDPGALLRFGIELRPDAPQQLGAVVRPELRPGLHAVDRAQVLDCSSGVLERPLREVVMRPFIVLASLDEVAEDVRGPFETLPAFRSGSREQARALAEVSRRLRDIDRTPVDPRELLDVHLARYASSPDLDSRTAALVSFLVGRLVRDRLLVFQRELLDVGREARVGQVVCPAEEGHLDLGKVDAARGFHVDRKVQFVPRNDLDGVEEGLLADGVSREDRDVLVSRVVSRAARIDRLERIQRGEACGGELFVREDHRAMIDVLEEFMPSDVEVPDQRPDAFAAVAEVPDRIGTAVSGVPGELERRLRRRRQLSVRLPDVDRVPVELLLQQPAGAAFDALRCVGVIGGLLLFRGQCDGDLPDHLVRRRVRREGRLRRKDRKQDAQQRQQCGEADAGGLTRLCNAEGWDAGIGFLAQADLVRTGNDVSQQLAHFLRCLAVVERGHQFNGVLQAFEIGGELGLDGGVKHDILPGASYLADSGFDGHAARRGNVAVKSPSPQRRDLCWWLSA